MASAGCPKLEPGGPPLDREEGGRFDVNRFILFRQDKIMFLNTACHLPESGREVFSPSFFFFFIQQDMKTSKQDQGKHKTSKVHKTSAMTHVTAHCGDMLNAMY